AVHAGLAELIDLDRATFAQFDARFLQPQSLRVWHASGSEHHAIDFQIVVIGHGDPERAAIELLDTAELGIEAEVDALGDRDLQQPVAQLLVIAAQQLVGPVDDRHAGAELVEDTSEFVGDIAAAGDQQAL